MNFAVAIFCLSTAFVLYILIGYPVLLAIWSRSNSRPIRKEFVPHPISIIVPVKNGIKWIDAKIASLLQSDYPPELLKILIVSDGSVDGTDEFVKEYPDPRVSLLSLPPGGKATAVNRGLEAVESQYLVFTDVRQAFDRQAIRRMISCFADPKVGLVTGELVIREGTTQEEFNTGLYWKYEKWIRRNLNRIDAMLGATGSIYAARREAIAVMPADILLDDVFMPFVAVSRGYRVYFEDDAKAYDLPTSLQSEFRRKVRTQAGVYQIIRYFPFLLTPGNRRFIHFASHKFGRLLLPFALLAIALSSFWLPSPWRGLALIAQALFYLLALADTYIPEGNPVKRLSAVLRAFIVLVGAALCAVAIFVMPAQALWKETRVRSARETTGTP
jgi:poly-beta-1,6-N-acetyl-D-glucosamine synthase